MQAVHLVGQLKKGQSVLVHAGASGVGLAAIQVARMGGASKVFATAGTDEKCEICRQSGADIAVNYRKDDFAEVLKNETDGGINIIVDMVGRDYWHRNTALAALEGKIVIVANLSGSKVDDFDLRPFIGKRLSVQGTTLRNRTPEYQNNLRDSFVEKCMPHFDGLMKIQIDKVFPWTQVIEAHKRMESNVNAGKIICTID